MTWPDDRGWAAYLCTAHDVKWAADPRDPVKRCWVGGCIDTVEPSKFFRGDSSWHPGPTRWGVGPFRAQHTGEAPPGLADCSGIMNGAAA